MVAIKVFLSSPGDVAEERGRAIKVLSRLHSERRYKSAGVRFEAVAWDGPGVEIPMLATETPQISVDHTLGKPSECDIAVVVLWSRIGTEMPVDQYHKPDGTPYRSGTEYEFLDAVSAQAQQGKPFVLLYRCRKPVLIDQDAPDAEERGRQYKEVKSFFSEFNDTQTHAIYRGVNDYKEPNEFESMLDSHVRELVERMLEAEHSVRPKKHLRNGLAASIFTVKFGIPLGLPSFRTAVENLVRLYVGTDKAPVPFGGRGLEIDALNNWLNATDEDEHDDVLSGNSDSNNLLITAPAGRGKTALLVHWIDQLKTDWSLVFVPVSIRYQTNQASTFYQAFAARLAEIVEEALPEPRANPADYYREKVIEYLDRIMKDAKRCLIVIDGLDEARGWKVDTTVLPFEPPPSLKIVISARELAGDRGSEDWLNRLGWTVPQSSALTLNVQPLSREGISDVLGKMAFPIAPLSRDVDIIDELYRLTENGDPLILHLYANDLLKQGENAARLSPGDLRKLKPGFGAYFKDWLEKQRDEWKAVGSSIDDELIDAILVVLATAFGPLELRDLEELVDRVLSRKLIFTANTIDPLRRFILGDGIESGYALAHPKLADYLRRDYFGNTKIVQKSQDAFIEWIRETVQDLNAGQKAPEDASRYALLFYTQHLCAITPSAKTLELFRELVEDGWRKAWLNYEGGTQGFSRDVELAARAFRSAAKEDPRLLQQPKTGLGGQIRCALCLSSIRSIGLGVPGEALAEFLRTNSITPKQALYLAQLKEDKKRAETIEAIIEFLPAGLRLEAYASARDILNPSAQFNTIFAIAPHLPEHDQQRAVLEALKASKRIKDDSERASALRKLKPFVTKTVWTEAFAAEENRREQKKREAQSTTEQRQPSSQPGLESSDLQAQHAESTVEWYCIAKKEELPELPEERIREILELLREIKGYSKIEPVRALAPHLSRELQVLALESIWHGRDTLFRGDALAALVPHLEFDLLEDVFSVATKTLGHDLNYPLVAIAERLDAAGLQRVFPAVLDIASDYTRTQALRAIARYLSPELLARALQHSLEIENEYSGSEILGAIVQFLPPELLERALRSSLEMEMEAYALGRFMSVLVPHLPLELLRQALAVARNVNEARRRVEILTALIPRLPRELLPEAFELAAQITHMQYRGRLLAKLLPRLRDAGLSTSLADAYSVAFVIGDGSFRALAEAALIPYLDEEYARSSVTELSPDSMPAVRDRDDVAIVLHVLAVVLTVAHLPVSVAARMLDEAVKLAHDLREKTIRALTLGVLAPRLSREHSNRVRAEIFEMARTSSGEGGAVMLALLLTLLTHDDVQSALEEARKTTELFTLKEDKENADATIRIASVLTTGRSVEEMRAVVAEALVTMDEPATEELKALALMVVLVFSPKLPDGETDDLIRDTLVVINKIDEQEARAMALAAIASYLPTPQLSNYISDLLEIGAGKPRLGFLLALTLAQGLARELFQGIPGVAGNRIPGSPLARLGGTISVQETKEAIRDVCRWWP